MRNILSDRIPSEELIAAEKEMIKIGSYLSTRHFHAALAGNISLRISEDCVLCTRHGADKGALRPGDFSFVAWMERRSAGRVSRPQNSVCIEWFKVSVRIFEPSFTLILPTQLLLPPHLRRWTR
jgi:hypothetical protein